MAAQNQFLSLFMIVKIKSKGEEKNPFLWVKPTVGASNDVFIEH